MAIEKVLNYYFGSLFCFKNVIVKLKITSIIKTYIKFIGGNHEENLNQDTYSVIQNYGGPAIKNNGILNIGNNDGIVSTNSLVIMGTTYAIDNIGTDDNGVLNLYDGILKGITDTINGTITLLENGYSQSNPDLTETIGESIYKIITLVEN